MKTVHFLKHQSTLSTSIGVLTSKTMSTYSTCNRVKFFFLLFVNMNNRLMNRCASALRQRGMQFT